MKPNQKHELEEASMFNNQQLHIYPCSKKKVTKIYHKLKCIIPETQLNQLTSHQVE